MPPQQEQIKVVPWETIPSHVIIRAILIKEQSNTPLSKTTTRGKYTPYFGSITRVRARRATLQVIEVGNLVSSLKQLMELHSWVKGNQNMTQFIETLTSEKNRHNYRQPTKIHQESLLRYNIT